VGKETVDEGTLEEIRAARQELDDVIDEIRKVPGYEDFLAAPTFDDVARAAGEQPLVYVAPADLGGLALVVSGTDVQHVPLDGLTLAAVHAQVVAYAEAYDAFRAAGGEQDAARSWRDAIDTATAWLWTEVMGPVIDAVRPAPAAVLVAGGLLGLLPLHAAWTADPAAPTGRRYALDELGLTFAPNARSLASARALAQRPVRRLLAVVDPTGSLPSAPAEAQASAASFGPAGNVLGGAALGPGEVAEAMREADAAHFACHGFAEPSAPLDSGLDLGGGRQLTLRDFFAQNLRMRLVVLSACETLLPGADLPDEVVALPTGLLQAGVGGIVASMWLVDDLATLILMTEFYRRWRWERLDPPAALRGAQRWLRDTPNGEIVRSYQEALDAGAGWLPREAALTVLTDLMLREPAERTYSGIDAWAGFAYVGA
jgi:hypothetical protein